MTLGSLHYRKLRMTISLEGLLGTESCSHMTNLDYSLQKYKVLMEIMEKLKPPQPIPSHPLGTTNRTKEEEDNQSQSGLRPGPLAEFSLLPSCFSSCPLDAGAAAPSTQTGGLIASEKSCCQHLKGVSLTTTWNRPIKKERWGRNRFNRYSNGGIQKSF